MAVLEDMDGDDSGEQYWLTQIRSFIRIAVYNISYIRGLFPEEFFRDYSFPDAGLTVKDLIPKNTESRRLIDWIEEGVNDALQKKYLETLLFCICEKDDGATIEEYSFTFRYPSASCEEAEMEFSLTGSKGNSGMFKSNAAESTADQIRVLIRHCAAMMSALDQIPQERTLLMKLWYYDDLTPEDYEPPLFKCYRDDEDDKDLAQIFGRLCCISERAPTLFLDSGASHHIFCNKSYMSEMRDISPNKRIELITADGKTFKAKQVGQIEFGNIHLNQVHYIPRMSFNFVSIGYLDKQGLLVSIMNSQVCIIDVSKSLHVGNGYRHGKNNDYILKAMKWMIPDEVELQLHEVDLGHDNQSWVIDSCCVYHMAGSIELLTGPKPFQKEFHTPRGGMMASHKGSVNKANLKLWDVLYCPANKDNLISVGVLDSQGYRITFYNGMCTIVCQDTMEEVGRGILDNSNLLYYLNNLETRNVVSKRKRNK